MKLTMNQIVGSQDALQHLMDQKLPVKVAYNLQRDLRLILQEIETFNKLNTDKIKELGSQIAPDQIRVKPENRNEYNEYMEELLLHEIELDLRPVKLDTLQGVDLTVRDVLLLDYLIEEASDE